MPIILPWPQSATDCRWMLCQAGGQNSVDENTDVDENMGGCWRKDDVMLTKIFDPRRPLTCGNIRQHMSTGYFRQQNFFSSPPPPSLPPLKRVRIIGWFLGRFLGLVVDHNHETFSLWGEPKKKFCWHNYVIPTIPTCIPPLTCINIRQHICHHYVYLVSTYVNVVYNN